MGRRAEGRYSRLVPVLHQLRAPVGDFVGREQEIDIGPMSGKSNVIFWLEKRGIPPTDAVVDRVFQKAKSSAPLELRDPKIGCGSPI